MGNRTHLFFGDYCEFEANNCLPVTWLALFTQQEFITEKYQHESKEYIATGYRTTQSIALQRTEAAINKLQGHTPVWAFLRPLEILREELKRCSQDTTLNLDLTQLWAVNENFSIKVTQATDDYIKMVGTLNGDRDQDIFHLTQLVNEFNLGHINSVVDLSPENLMFILIGMYWGTKEREDLYSIKYFSDAYWVT